MCEIKSLTSVNVFSNKVNERSLHCAHECTHMQRKPVGILFSTEDVKFDGMIH